MCYEELEDPTNLFNGEETPVKLRINQNSTPVKINQARPHSSILQRENQMVKIKLIRSKPILESFKPERVQTSRS